MDLLKHSNNQLNPYQIYEIKKTVVIIPVDDVFLFIGMVLELIHCSLDLSLSPF